MVDPEFEGFRANLDTFSALTGQDCLTWTGYLAAHRTRRAFFKSMGATSTDHGHPTAATANLSPSEAEALFLDSVGGMLPTGGALTVNGRTLRENLGLERPASRWAGWCSTPGRAAPRPTGRWRWAGSSTPDRRAIGLAPICAACSWKRPAASSTSACKDTSR